LSAYSFGEPRDSCHFGLVWTRRETSSAMRSRFDGYDDEQSIIAIAIRLYCNYGGGVTAKEDRRRGLPSSRRCFLRVYLRGLYLYLPDEDRSELLQRFLRALSLSLSLSLSLCRSLSDLSLSQGGLVVTQRASQNSCCIFDDQEVD